MVTAQQGQDNFFIHHHNHGLYLIFGGGAAFDLLKRRDTTNTWCRESFRLIGATFINDDSKLRRSTLNVCHISTIWTSKHVIFARRRGNHKLDTCGTTHRPRRGLNRHRVKAKPLKNLHIRVVVGLKREVKPHVIQVETVRVLHRELSHAEKTTLGSRLISEFCLDLIPDLWQFFIRIQRRCDAGKDFFVSHPESELDTTPISQTEHLIAHQIPPATLFPQRRWMHRRQKKFLTTDGIHFFPDDTCDFFVNPQPKWQ